jgi:hypothetical protein
MELNDGPQSFVWSIEATGTHRYEIPYHPLNATSVQAFVDSVDVTSAVEVEEHSGVITFDHAPVAGATITIQGNHYKFFTDAELCQITNAAVQEHLYHRVDAFQRKMTVANLPMIEEYPVSILGTIQAMYTLATDASFDIDIQTPDGINIPRAERYRQLMDAIRMRKEQYDDLCKALNIGLTRIDVFTARRISGSTNRYVPVYLPQEVDDPTPPARVILPIPTYGGDPVPSTAANYDLTFTQGDDFSADLVFPFDITGYTPKAQIRIAPTSASIVAEITCTFTDPTHGKMTISLTSSQTMKIPLRACWDLKFTSPDPENFTETYLRGQVFCVREVTQGTTGLNNANWSPTGWEGT